MSDSLTKHHMPCNICKGSQHSLETTYDFALFFASGQRTTNILHLKDRGSHVDFG